MAQKQISNGGEMLVKDALAHVTEICAHFEPCRHCFAAKIFAFTIILSAQRQQLFKNEFKERMKHIVDGLLQFLQQRFTSAVYILLPQLDGMVRDHLTNAGILVETSGYPIWTNRASVHKPNTPCKNIAEAIKEGVQNKRSRIGKTVQLVKYPNEWLESYRELRNNITHGSTVEINEEKASDIVLLLQALYHDLELYEITKPNPKIVSP
jgi:hypothetical protein